MAERITIVSGSPGAGKTSLCRLLAARDPRGVHLETDLFYAFPAHPIDPSTPASREQNHAVVSAFTRAAGAFAEAGYRVYLDGIVGPWFLPLVARELAPLGAEVEYVVLSAALERALERVAGRENDASPRVVRHMHRAFEDLGSLEHHRVDTTERSPEEVAGLLAEAPNRFRLDLSVQREG